MRTIFVQNAGSTYLDSHTKTTVQSTPGVICKKRNSSNKEQPELLWAADFEEMYIYYTLYQILLFLYPVKHSNTFQFILPKSYQVIAAAANAAMHIKCITLLIICSTPRKKGKVAIFLDPIIPKYLAILGHSAIMVLVM